MIRRLVNSLFLLFLLIVSVSSQKQGDFGLFSVCSKSNDTIRLKCYYAKCDDSPPFSCQFYSNGTHLGRSSDDSCKEFTNRPTSAINYTCVLKRKKRTENITVLIDPNATEKKHKLMPCSGTPGLQLYQTPTFLWPLIVLSLWGVLETDRQLT